MIIRIIRAKLQRAGNTGVLAGSPSGQDLNIVRPNWQPPPGSPLALPSSLLVPLSPLCSYATIYRELERTILAANTQEDLKWFSNNHGPGMHMNWPAFEVRHRTFTPELTSPAASHLPSHLSLPFSCVSSPGVQPRPGQRSPEEEEAGRGPAHSEHGPRGATWRPQQVGSRPRLSTPRAASTDDSDVCVTFNKCH